MKKMITRSYNGRVKSITLVEGQQNDVCASVQVDGMGTIVWVEGPPQNVRLGQPAVVTVDLYDYESEEEKWRIERT